MNLFEKQARLNQLFAQSPVTTAYLSGSLAGRSAFGQITDIDIAILLMEQIRGDNFLDYQMFFLSELTKRLESDAIDVVILNQASLLLKLQVIKYGQILFTRDEKKRLAFETKSIMAYLDFKKLDDLQNQALSQRIYSKNVLLDREAVQAQVVQLSDHIKRLQQMRGATLAELQGDFRLRAAIERYLQLAIEGCLQTCNQLIASLGLRHPESFTDLLTTIANQSIISKPLALHLTALTELREGLLHNPASLDIVEIHKYLADRLGDLEDFVSQVTAYIGTPE